MAQSHSRDYRDAREITGADAIFFCIFFGGTSISRHAFLRIGALLLLPLLLLYGCMRYLKRQERIRRELKEMGLKFL